MLAAGGRCYAEAEARGELSTNHPNATGEVTRIALELGAEARDLDALQYHPNGGAWPATMQGYSIPETTRAYGAVLLNADGEEFTDSLGPRDAVSQAIFDEVEAGQRNVTPRTGAQRSGSTRRGSPRRTPTISLPYMLRRYRGAGIDPLREKILTYPVLHYQNGGLVIDEHAETTLEGAVRLRRDRGWHARSQPDDGKLPARVLRVRPPSRPRGCGEGERMSTVTTTDLAGAVEDAAAHLYVWALKDIPQDLRDALAAARDRETSTTGHPRARDHPPERRRSPTSRRTSSARTPASPSTRAASASTSRCTRRGSTRR